MDINFQFIFSEAFVKMQFFYYPFRFEKTITQNQYVYPDSKDYKKEYLHHITDVSIPNLVTK
jgi:hypothetical protein